LKVLWISKHTPLPTQIAELKRLYGEDVEINKYDNPYASAADIVKTYRQGFYNEMVLIAPLSVCRIIVGYGIKPLYSQMEQLNKADPRIEISVNNSKEKTNGYARHYRFVRFKRMEKLEIVFSELESPNLDS
jgi:hypothetical protein